MARLVKEYEVILDIFGKNKKGETIPFSKASEVFEISSMDIQFILAESDYRGGGLKAQKALRISLFYCRSKGIDFGFASCLKNQ